MQECVYILNSIYSRDTLHSVYKEQCICKILYYVCWKIKRRNKIECDLRNESLSM